MQRIVLAFAVCCASGCGLFPIAGGRKAPATPSPIQLVSHTDESEKRVVYVMSNGFHTGIIVRQDDVPRDAWPEVDLMEEHPWVEVGWGSEIFYRAKKITAPVVLGAIVPNPSVLHVVGWDDSPEIVFVKTDLVRLEVDEQHFAALCRHVHKSYAVDATGQTQNLGAGIYGDESTFYRADGKYYFPNTCNVWTARGLKLAGVPIVPELCGAAKPVLAAARNAGATIYER